MGYLIGMNMKKRKTHVILTMMLLHWFLLQSSELSAQQLPLKERDNIMLVLNDQVKDWNTQNIEGFMSGYWQSDSLKFIGKSGITKGWKNTLENYKKNYPDKNAMGTLRFEILSIEGIHSKSAMVIGKWYLTRTIGDVQGIFSLLFKKINGKWLIVCDHSS